jgi:hypothetical protein
MKTEESIELNFRELSPIIWSLDLLGTAGTGRRSRERFPSRKRWIFGGSFGQRLLSVSGLPKLSNCRKKRDSCG